MNLKPLSVWSFLLSLFSYLMCLVNIIIVLVMVLPAVTRAGISGMDNTALLRGSIMSQMESSSYLTVTTLLGWVAILISALALIFAIVALVRAKGEKYPGKGFAVTGLILSVVYLGLALLGIIIGLFAGNSMMGTVSV